MSPRTFRASKAKQVLSQISRELGPDTTIISHRKIRDSKGNFLVEATASPRTEGAVSAGIPLAEGTTRTKFSSKKLLVPFFVSIALIIAGTTVWELLSRKETAAASKIENSIAVISFENQTGDEAYDYLQRAIPNLLITSLEQRGGLYVATWERLRDLLKQMGKDEVEFIDSDTGFSLCRREGVGAIVLGSFVKAGDVFVTDVKVLDVETKKMLKGASARGRSVDSILERQIDELSTEICRSLSAASQYRVAASLYRIADVTTTSIEAYDHFLKGEEARAKLYYEEARVALERAVELDPDFAMAHAKLALSYYGLQNIGAGDNALKKAKDLSLKTTEKERLEIEALYASQIGKDEEKYFRLLQLRAEKFPRDKGPRHRLGLQYYVQRAYDKAIAEYTKVLELDPHFGPAHNVLGFAYSEMGDFSKAVEHIKKYVELNPDEANPLDSLAEVYFWMGKMEEATAGYKEALEIKPDFYSPYFALGYIHALKEDRAEVMNWFDKLIAVAPPGIRKYGFLWRGFYRYWLGSLEGCLLDLCEAEKISEPGYAWGVPFINLMKAFIEYDRGEIERSREHNELWLNEFIEEHPDRKFYYQGTYRFLSGLLEIKVGHMDGAEKILADMKILHDEMPPYRKQWVAFYIDFLSAELALEGGCPERAIAIFKEKSAFRNESMGFYPSGILYNLPVLKDVVPRAYVRMGDIDRAIAEYERLIVFDPRREERRLAHPKYYYRSAELYEQKGMKRKAIAHYQKFLDLWQDADSDLPEVIEAKKRLSQLQQRIGNDKNIAP
jgi:tetratricopeptide (TPR) repeat protein